MNSNRHIDLWIAIDLEEAPDYDTALEESVEPTEFRGYQYLSGIRTWEWFFGTQERADKAFGVISRLIAEKGLHLANSKDSLQRGTAWLAKD